jgi:hypothetical protein
MMFGLVYNAQMEVQICSVFDGLSSLLLHLLPFFAFRVK